MEQATRPATARAGQAPSKQAGWDQLLLRNVPQELQERRQWLVWRFIEKDPGSKPAKTPFYANGELRGWPLGQPKDASGRVIRDGKGRVQPTEQHPQVEQGHELDRAALVTMDEALRVARGTRWAGVGFAFLPGDGLVGIDVDRAIDTATGEMAEHCWEVITRADSYTELSPSGTGVHVIARGELKTFKDNDVGVEVFCGRQFFTFTGRLCGEAKPVQALTEETVGWLHKLVKGDKAPASPAPAPKAAQAGHTGASRYCIAALDSAVQRMRGAGEGRRNDTLNTEVYGLAQLVHTGGITESLITAALTDAARAAGLGDKEIEQTIGSAMRAGLATPRPLPERAPMPAAKQTRAARAVAAEKREQAMADDQAPQDKPRTRAKGGKGGDEEKPSWFWPRVDELSERFALIYGTDTAWDHREQIILRVPTMRLAFGTDVVKGWLQRIAAGDERVQVVRAIDLVFEPGQQVPDHQINMFGGLEVKPIPCDSADVKPMLDLLQHLCSESGDADTVDQVMHWVLRWQALPLQRLGSKMQTACVFHGPQGTGKNLYWDMWRDLFGVYGITVTQSELEDKFNGWVSRKLAIVGDEVVSRQEMYHNKNRLKLIVTQGEKFAIRGMMQETRWESNHANVVFLSNESQPLALEERDRRYLVVYTPLEADPKLYQAVRDFKANGGLGKWLHYLQTYPLEDFDAHTKPVMTRAKEALIERNWRPQERFVSEWLEGLLDLPVRVCSAEQLYRAFRRWCDQQGERWPPAQATFTKDVERWVKERCRRGDDGRMGEPRLTYKQIALKDQLVRKTVRCWLPAGTGVPPGASVTEGEWAAESVRDFEDALSRFCRRPHIGDDE